MDRTVDPGLVARFRAAIGRLAPAGRIGLAVSGGPDSLGLLLLSAGEMPGRFSVATVNHGLRPAGVQECDLVERICAERGIPCETLTVVVEPGNLQQEARRARYAALGEWSERSGLCAIATAHHADDQAETLLMRLNRGSGLNGLAAIRPSTMVSGCSIPVIRPLLEMRRSELAEVVANSGLEAVADPSNGDDRFDRVRIRRALEQADWIDPVALARSAHLLGEAEETFAAMTDVAWKENVAVVDGRVAVSLSPWREINLRLLERALAVAGGRVPRSDIAALIDRLSADGAKSNLGGVLVERSGRQLLCRPEPPRRTG